MQGLVPVWEARMPHAAEPLNVHAVTTETHVLWSLGTATPEPTRHN